MRRTVFVGHELQALDDPIDYFLRIQPMDSNHFIQIWQTIQPEFEATACEHTEIVARQKMMSETPQGSLLAGYALAQKLIQYGMDLEEMTATRRRHYFQFFVILYYKHQGFNQAETVKKVMEWASRERACGRSKSSIEEIEQDVQADVKCIFAENKHFGTMICDEILVSHVDIAYVQSIADDTTRKVVWCIIILGRMFHVQGRFFFSFRKIEEITGCKKSTVYTRVRQLIENRFIELQKQGSYYKQQANIYYMRLLEQWQPDKTLPIEATTLQEIFENTYTLIDTMPLADAEGMAL
ncbi:hypothetical protein [Cohnella terricola]|uniref:Uncharacterized protein n=1 Tax=Cohnella terricola TaxID=1289167 RepID=A0A559JDK1_9BACL|nr:hypothetical protein [Cohnella terricola]TVX97952.1 hypothetical protein FPZ45_17045 [Cohnella terricola]